MRFYILTFLTLLLLTTGCKRSAGDKAKSVYVGGQIVNPNSPYFILSKDDETLDTIHIDSTGKFGKKIDNIEPGIYTFKHNPENQIMYLEPGDSLLIWLNTLSFDQSINFSGRGAQESNFLLNMFLLNQKNNDLILSYYKIKPEKFAKLTDSIKNERTARLKKLEEKYDFSKNFKEIAKASINYEYYDLRERYSFLIKKYYSKFEEDFPQNFYDYRKDINFNKENLQNFYVYLNLIDDYLRTKSIEYCQDHHIDNKQCYDLNNFENIKRRIHLIDSLSDTPNIKNEFLDRLASQSITLSNTESRVDSVLDYMKSIGYTNQKALEKLARVQKIYLVGKSMKDKVLLNTNREFITYQDLLNKPIITYTWSMYSPTHHRWQHRIIKNLRKKYPEINFVGVNIDEGEVEDWLEVLDKNNYNKKFEFQLAKRNLDKETLRNYLSKMLFINKKGIIVRGDAQLNPVTFENEVLEFLNQ